MTRSITRRAALAGAASVFAAATAAHAQTTAPDLMVLRLASSPADDTMPVLYAQQSGAFRRVGLDVRLVRSASGSAVASAVAGGALDIGKSSIVSIITAFSKGLPFVWIAPASMYNPAQPDGGLIVAADSPLKTARDLNALATRAWLDQNGGDSKTVAFVEIPVSAQAAAVADGRVAAAGIINPFLADALAAGKTRMFAPFYSAIAKRFMLSGWFTTTDFVAKHKDAITNFQQIVATSAPYTNAHHLETAPLLATWSGITPDQALHAQRMTMGTVIAADIVQPVIDLLAKYGSIPKPFDAHDMIVEGPR